MTGATTATSGPLPGGREAGPATRMDPRRQRSRAMALQAAAELLVEGGLSALTVEGVTERSGVAKTTVYRHWPTRRELVQDAFWRLAPLPEEPIGTGPLVDRLSGPLMRAAALFMEQPVLPALAEAVLRDPELASFHDEFVAAQLGELRAVLAQAQAQDEIRPEIDAEDLLVLSLGALMARTSLLRQRLTRDDVTRVVDLVLAAAGRQASR